jgi:hypothetical protein
LLGSNQTQGDELKIVAQDGDRQNGKESMNHG